MSGDEKGLKHMDVEEENSTENTETTDFSEAISERTADDGGQEELPAAAVVEGIPQELQLGDIRGREEEPPAAAIGGGQEASTSSGYVPRPNILLGLEDVKKAYISNVRKEYNQYKSIRDDLKETIESLKLTSRRNPGNWAMFEHLREQINQAHGFLSEVRDAMSVQQSRAEYMSFQINEFFERRSEEGENFEGRTIPVGTIGGVDVTIQTDYIPPPSVEPNAVVDKIAQVVVDHMMHGSRLRQNEGELAERERMEADRAADDPRAMGAAAAAAAAADYPRAMGAAADAAANMAEERDDEGRLRYPIVTGKYTLAIRAHHLYPESSSEDSSPEECDRFHEGAGRNVREDIAVVEERMAVDPEESSSSDSPVEESSHQL